MYYYSWRRHLKMLICYTLTAGSAGAIKISCCESGSCRVSPLRCLTYYMTKIFQDNTILQDPPRPHYYYSLLCYHDSVTPRPLYTTTHDDARHLKMMTYYILTAGSAGAKKISCCESSRRVFTSRCLTCCYMTKAFQDNTMLQDPPRPHYYYSLLCYHDSVTPRLHCTPRLNATVLRSTFFFLFFLFSLLPWWRYLKTMLQDESDFKTFQDDDSQQNQTKLYHTLRYRLAAVATNSCRCASARALRPGVTRPGG